MSGIALRKTYSPPPLNRREILRYAGCKNTEPEVDALLESTIAELMDKLSYKVCYRALPCRVEGDLCHLGPLQLRSQDLATNLRDCEQVLLFAATIGVEPDRLISKYGRLSPARALLLQAMGAERIEALCNTFCRDMEKELEVSLQPRFSPGYGDLPLLVQREIFALLDCGKHLGLSLNDSLLISPTKSVTAFVGLKKKQTGGTT